MSNFPNKSWRSSRKTITSVLQIDPPSYYQNTITEIEGQNFKSGTIFSWETVFSSSFLEYWNRDGLLKRLLFFYLSNKPSSISIFQEY